MRSVTWDERLGKSTSEITRLADMVSLWTPSLIQERKRKIKNRIWKLVISSSHLISPIWQSSQEHHESFLKGSIASVKQYSILGSDVIPRIIEWLDHVSYIPIPNSEQLSNEVSDLSRRHRERVYYNLMIWNYALVAANKWFEKSRLTKNQIKDTFLFWVTANWINENVEKLIRLLKTDSDTLKQFSVAQTTMSSITSWVVVNQWIEAGYTTISNACAWVYSSIARSVEKIMSWNERVAISVYDSFKHAFGLSSMNKLWTLWKVSMPFDKWAHWFVPSEAAWFYLIELKSEAEKRWIEADLEICWWSEASDAKVNILKPVSDIQAKWMLEAIYMSWLRPEDIDWVVAHWTSTQAWDMIEAIALRAVFWDHRRDVSIMSPKVNTWHTMAASWAVWLECAYTVLKYWISPKNNLVKEPIPEIEGFDLDQWKSKRFKHILLNSFWFWGINSFLVVKLPS